MAEVYQRGRPRHKGKHSRRLGVHTVSGAGAGALGSRLTLLGGVWATQVMVFRAGGKEYRGASALEIVQALRREAARGGGDGRPLRQFLLDSLEQLRDRIPLREIDVSDRLGDETLALSYLYLRDEFGAGRLSHAPERRRRAHTL